MKKNRNTRFNSRRVGSASEEVASIKPGLVECSCSSHCILPQWMTMAIWPSHDWSRFPPPPPRFSARLSRLSCKASPLFSRRYITRSWRDLPRHPPPPSTREHRANPARNNLREFVRIQPRDILTTDTDCLVNLRSGSTYKGALDISPVLFQCWATVVDGGLTLKQNRLRISCLLHGSGSV